MSNDLFNQPQPPKPKVIYASIQEYIDARNLIISRLFYGGGEIDDLKTIKNTVKSEKI